MGVLDDNGFVDFTSREFWTVMALSIVFTIISFLCVRFAFHQRNCDQCCTKHKHREVCFSMLYVVFLIGWFFLVLASYPEVKIFHRIFFQVQQKNTNHQTSDAILQKIFCYSSLQKSFFLILFYFVEDAGPSVPSMHFFQGQFLVSSLSLFV